MELPPPGTDQKPAWLDWTQEAWAGVRERWYEQMDKLLNIETYLARYLYADQRVTDAQLELREAEQKLTSLGRDAAEGDLGGLAKAQTQPICGQPS